VGIEEDRPSVQPLTPPPLPPLWVHSGSLKSFWRRAMTALSSRDRRTRATLLPSVTRAVPPATPRYSLPPSLPPSLLLLIENTCSDARLPSSSVSPPCSPPHPPLRGWSLTTVVHI